MTGTWTRGGVSRSGPAPRTLVYILAALLTVPVNAYADPSVTSTFPWRIDASGPMARAGSVVFSTNASFAVPSVRAGSMLILSGTEGVVEASVGVAAVEAMVSDSAGGWYVARRLSTLEAGESVVEHVLANGSLDPAFAVTVLGDVSALALGGPLLFIGGQYGEVNGADRRHLAAVSSTTGVVSTTVRPTVDGSVDRLLIAGNTLFVAGAFTTAGGQARRKLAAFTTSGQLATQFVADVASGFPLALLETGGFLFVGGTSLAIGGVAPRALVRLNATTGAISLGWEAAVTGDVYGLAIANGVLYIGGDFSAVGGLPRNNLAAVTSATGAVTTWRADADPFVFGLTANAGALYVVGSFGHLGGVRRLGAAAVTLTEPTRLLEWNPAVGPQAFQVAASSGRIAVGGRLAGWGGTPQSSVTAVDVSSGRLLPWRVDANGSIDAMIVVGSRLLLGGRFTTVNGVVRRGLAAFDLGTRMLLPLAVPVEGSVSALAAAGDVLYLGGNFTAAGGQLRTDLAAVDLRTGLVLPWNAASDDEVRSLAVQGARILVGGNFTTLSGSNGVRLRRGLGEITDSGVVTDFDAAMNVGSSVGALALDGQALFVGGTFTTVKGAPRQNVAALTLPTPSTPTGVLLPWRSDASSRVRGISVHRDVVYLAGLFSSVNGTQRSGLARVSRTSGSVDPWAPVLDNDADAVSALDDGVLVVAEPIDRTRGKVHFFSEEQLAGPPGAPLLPMARMLGSTIDLQWAAPVIGPIPTSYRLEAGTAPGLSNLGTLRVATSRFAVGGVPPGTYFVRVRAVGPGGVGPTSEEISFVVGAAGCTMPPLMPDPPTVVVNGTGNTVTLKWTPPPGSPATTYSLAVGSSPGLGNLGVIPVGATTTLVAGDVPNGVYFARLVAANACGASLPSGDTRIAVGGALGPPESPVQFSASTSAGTVAFSWFTSTSGGTPTGYVLETGSGPGLANLAVIPLPATTTFVVPGVPKGTYYVRLRALNAVGASLPAGDIVLIVP